VYSLYGVKFPKPHTFLPPTGRRREGKNYNSSLITLISPKETRAPAMLQSSMTIPKIHSPRPKSRRVNPKLTVAYPAAVAARKPRKKFPIFFTSFYLAILNLITRQQEVKFFNKLRVLPEDEVD